MTPVNTHWRRATSRSTRSSSRTSRRTADRGGVRVATSHGGRASRFQVPRRFGHSVACRAQHTLASAFPRGRQRVTLFGLPANTQRREQATATITFRENAANAPAPKSDCRANSQCTPAEPMIQSGDYRTDRAQRSASQRPARPAASATTNPVMRNGSEWTRGTAAVSGTLPTGGLEGRGVTLGGVGAGEGLGVGGGSAAATTVTLKVPLAVLPAASVALQLTTVAPGAD